MAKEISLDIFEKNARLQNKKNLRRSYTSIPSHSKEYINVLPLSARKEVVLEATLDKEYADKFISFLKKNKFKVLGSVNYYHLENVILDYDNNKELYVGNEEAIKAVKRDLKELKKSKTDYKEIEDEDVIFYFLPYNDSISNLFEFMAVYKDKIQKFTKDNDITIVFKISGYCNQIDGFFGFNFFDADVKDKEVIVDYASRVNVMVDFLSNSSVYAAGLFLNTIGDSVDELIAVNTHIIAENIKFEK